MHKVNGNIADNRFTTLCRTVAAMLALCLPLFTFSQQALTLTERADGNLLIRNGLTGIVIPSEKNIRQKGGVMAPIQSFILADGRLTDSSSNLLTSRVPVTHATLEQTRNAEQITCLFRYQFSDTGFYTCRITLMKNSRSIRIEEDSNDDLGYTVQVGKSREFDRARYRGWVASDPEWGREPDGRAYREENNRKPLDASVNLKYSSATRYPLMSNWDPAGGEVNTGRYWQAYSESGTQSTPLFGIFQGKPSLLVGNKFAGVRFITSAPTPKATGTLELKMELERRGPDNSYYPRKRFQWCVYISTKKDLLPPDQYQPIGIEMNRVSGVADQVAEYCTKPLQLNEQFLKGAIYLNDSSVQSMIKRVKADQQYYEKLLAINPSIRQTLDAWRYPDSAASLKRYVLLLYADIKKELVQGDGTHAFNIKYWMGSMYYKNIAMLITTLFADPAVRITDGERQQMTEFLRLMARLLWDDNYVPFFDSSGINFGTANMSYQYRNNGRNFFALIFSGDPEFRDRARNVHKQAESDLLKAISANGISFASPHYTQATIEPILYTMLQLKRTGVADLFKDQKDRLQKFAAFYTSLLTPPSVRFMGYRKLVSIGDGSEESAAVFALLAAGMKDVDPSLANNLYYIFENGAPRQSQFGSLGLAIDLFPHQGKVHTGSANFQGYLSHARSGLGSPRESASWIINGEVYLDHRNDDRGELILYALGAPLSLSRSSFYSPHAPDARIRSLVVPERLFPEWKSAQQPINGENKLGNPWLGSDVKTFGKYDHLTHSTSLIRNGQLSWSRQFIMIYLNAEEPLFIVYDSLSNNEPAIWSMNFMSEVVTENNSTKINIIPKTHNNGNLAELPSGTPERTLKAGWNSFQFLGQPWAKHPDGGINWTMHLFTAPLSSYSFSQWSTTWQNSQESDEFRKYNDRPYSETQQILRWRSAKPFFSVILPYGKKETSSPYKITSTGNYSIQFTRQDRTYQVTPWSVDIRQGNGKRTISFLGDDPASSAGIRAEGGSCTVQIEGNTVLVMVSGRSGTRKITLPFEVVAANDNIPIPQTQAGRSNILIPFQGEANIYPEMAGFKTFTYMKK